MKWKTIVEFIFVWGWMILPVYAGSIWLTIQIIKEI